MKNNIVDWLLFFGVKIDSIPLWLQNETPQELTGFTSWVR